MSAARPGGLGRGLGELFQRTDLDEDQGGHQRASAPMPDGSYFAEIPVAEVSPNPRQPRQSFDEESLTELAESIKEVGLLQPIVVRKADAGYELIVGERRWRAHQVAGLAEIPAIVRATEDGHLLRDALLENLHRAQLNQLEEAAAYQQLLEDYGCSKEELAARVKKSRPHISNTLRLLGLPTPVQRRVAAGILTAGHARAILVLSDPLEQEKLAQRIVAEGLSVRAAEEVAALATREPATDVLPRRRIARQVPEQVQAYAVGLADRLDTRVQVSLGARKGRLTIEFADTDDLDRIMQMLGR